MSDVRYIVRQVLEIEKAREVLNMEYNEKIKNLDSKLKAVQASCKHQVNKHHPDASANNDSWDECEICGYVS